MFITPATYKPDQAWIIEQAEAFSQYTKDQELPCKILMHDNDRKYSQPFLDALKISGIKTKRTAKGTIDLDLIPTFQASQLRPLTAQMRHEQIKSFVKTRAVSTE